MKRPKLPDLDTTERRYLDNTAHARLASPGIQRFARRRGGAGRVVVAVALLALLVGAMFVLVSSR
jgi:hypothetical protein